MRYIHLSESSPESVAGPVRVLLLPIGRGLRDGQVWREHPLVHGVRVPDACADGAHVGGGGDSRT